MSRANNYNCIKTSIILLLVLFCCFSSKTPHFLSLYLEYNIALQMDSFLKVFQQMFYVDNDRLLLKSNVKSSTQMLANLVDRCKLRLLSNDKHSYVLQINFPIMRCFFLSTDKWLKCGNQYISSLQCTQVLVTSLVDGHRRHRSLFVLSKTHDNIRSKCVFV